MDLIFFFYAVIITQMFRFPNEITSELEKVKSVLNAVEICCSQITPLRNKRKAPAADSEKQEEHKCS